MKSLNLNSTIKVKLTPRGTDIFYHQNDKLNEYIKANGGSPLEPCMPSIDNEGYTKFQLWDFMNIYGAHFKMGMIELPIDGLNIYIEDEDLKEEI